MLRTNNNKKCSTKLTSPRSEIHTDLPIPKDFLTKTQAGRDFPFKLPRMPLQGRMNWLRKFRILMIKMKETMFQG